jgi:PAS domain S-box-containing protein
MSALLFYFAYVAGAGLGQRLAIIPGVAITFWLPAGIFAAALLTTKRWQWPWWITIAFIAELTANKFWFHNPASFAVIYFTANALTAATAACLIAKFTGHAIPLQNFRELAVVIIMGAGIAPIVSATLIGATDHVIGKHPFQTVWPLVWLGDGSGLLVSLPLTLVLIQAWRERPKLKSRQSLEAVATILVLLVIAVLAFQGTLPSLYLILPILLWIAASYQFQGAVIAMAALTLLASFYSSSKSGIFAGQSSQIYQKIVGLQAFLSLSAVLSLIVATLSYKHERTHKKVDDVGTDPSQLENSELLLPRIAGILSMALGALVLLGWVFGLNIVTSAGLGQPTMKANTALCFIALGTALAWKSQISPSKRVSNFILIAPLFTLAIALAALIDYTFGVNSRLDQLLFVDNSTTIFPGRMSPTTAGAFFAASLALLIPRLLTDHFNAQTLLWAVVLTVSSVALAGYATDQQELYQVPPYSSMAVHTAAGFVVLSVGGLVLSWPKTKIDDLFMRGAATDDASRYLFAIVMVLFAAWLRVILAAVTGLNELYATFYLAVIIVALVAGWRTGIFAGVASALIVNYYFTSPVGFIPLDSGNFTSLVIFVVTGFAVSYLSDQWVKLYERIVAERNHLDRIVDERTAVLQQTNHQLKLALSAANMTAWHYAPKIGTVTLNNNAARLVDLLGQETLTKAEDGFEAIHPDDREAHRLKVEAALAAKGSYVTQYRHGHGEHSIWLEEHAQVVVDPDSNATNIIGVTANVSARIQAEQALQESQRNLAAVFEALPLGVALIDQNGKPIMSNEVFKSFAPQEIPSRDHARQELWQGYTQDGKLIEPHDYPGARALRGEKIWPGQEFLFWGNPGSRPIWTRVAAIPIRDQSGRIVGATAVVADVDQEKRASDGLRESEARFKHASELARFGAYEYDVATNRAKWSPGFFALVGRDDVKETSMESFLQFVHADDRLRVSARIDAIKTQIGPYELEYRIMLADGSDIWVMDRGEISATSDNSTLPAVRAVGIVLDITERKRNEQHQALMMNELNHRVKNTLATIQSMASQTMRSSPDLAQARTRFEARLLSLSKAHDVLTREKWESASLNEIVDRAIFPYSGQFQERFVVEGPAIRVPAQMALAFAMTLHELCTNAVKYGALSKDHGKVSITWKIAKSRSVQRTLIFRWVEKDGPVVAMPSAKGFGTKLIERNLASELGGKVKMSFAKTGLVCVITTTLNGGTPKRPSQANRKGQ